MKSWIRPVAAIATLTIVVDGFMLLADTGPNLALVTALCVVVGVALWFIADLVNSTVEISELALLPPSPPTHLTDRRVMRLRSGLVYGRRDETSLEQLRAGLVDLVDDQLGAVYHIDRAQDPGAARAVLGDQLFEFVSDPKAARGLERPQQLDRIVTLIERI
jgi:hypothetical protein